MIELLATSPATLEVKNFLRKREVEIYDEVLGIGSTTQRGRGIWLVSYDKPISTKFTGLGLCLFSSVFIKEMLDKQFPQNQTDLIAGRVTPIDALTDEDMIDHFWLRTTIGGERFLVDGTYGQRNPWMNRLVFDHSINEAYYYGTKYSSFKTRVPFTAEQIGERIMENRLLMAIA